MAEELGIPHKEQKMIPPLELGFQLLLAGVLGGLVGLERERKHWYAGLRTHMLVCIGSTLIMIVSQYGFEQIIRSGLIVLDPSRVAAQVVSGIGFLGAGTILFWKNKIKGLTTAASLWSVAAVGLAIGGGLYLAAFITTALIVMTLALLKPVEKLFFGSSLVREIKIYTTKGFSLDSLNNNIKSLNLVSFDIKIDHVHEKEIISFFAECDSNFDVMHLIDEIKKVPGIEHIELID